MLLDRTKYIGGSDCSAILGRNGYDHYLHKWRVKTGREESDFDNFHMRRGNIIEPLIEDYVRAIDPTCNSREQFERWCPQKLDEYDSAIREGRRIPQIFLTDPDKPYVGGHPDGVSDDYIDEFKAPAPRNLERYLKEGFPVDWRFQMHHYGKIAGKKKARLWVWDFNKWEPICIEYDLHPRVFEIIDEVYPQFWLAVEMDVQPPALLEAHKEHFNYISDSEMDKLLGQYSEYTELRYQYEESQRVAKGAIIEHLNGKTRLETDNFYVTASFMQAKGYSYWKLIVKAKQEGNKDEKA